ncbi:MAG: hypothetical protein Q4E88_05220 [Coriobacteriia bacterium]|nr:hypothetical protein [Coriobacteriia bacterium]
MDKKTRQKASEEALDKYIEEASNDDFGPEKRYATFFNLITKATIAEMQGELMSSVYLYLAAYETGKSMDDETIANAILGLQNAWKTAVGLQNRPVCEAIFEIFTHHMSEDELKPYSDDLHDVMLAKLKDLGFPIDSIKGELDLDKLAKEAVQIPPKKTNKPDTFVFKQNDIFKYENLVGYDSAIAAMRELGLGAHKQNEFMQLIKKLNQEHGLDRVAFTKTLIFKSPSRVDAKIFTEATAGEIGLPCIRMRMDEGFQGQSVLSLVAPANGNFRLNPTRTGFNGKGILLLEDVDLWEFPEIDVSKAESDMESMMAAQVSRGIAEVLNLIDIALQDPNILVCCTVGSDFNGESLLVNLIDDFKVINVDYPNDAERYAIWTMLSNDHPSLRAFSLNKLVEYSKNMSRYSIEVAAHDALEDAYKAGIEKREFVPLTIVNLLERLAEHLPLESSEYKNLEDKAAASFKRELDNIDDIL